MSLHFWMIGKTKEAYLLSGIEEYQKRVVKYAKIDVLTIPDVKNAASLPVSDLKKQEASQILKLLQPNDVLILLDENGQQYSSRSFAKMIESKLNHSAQRTIFLIGGAFGFDEALYERSPLKISLSTMTFSHQLIRLIFWEQLYRAFSIIHGLPYHND
jgi:23S rRNA (pseudouridine1915-N3)-methyltransferase